MPNELITAKQLEDKGLLAALAKIFREPANARALLVATGYPCEQIPTLRSDNPIWFWRYVAEQIENGLIPGVNDLRPLLAEAARVYPGNQDFAPWRHLHRTSSLPGSPIAADPVSGNRQIKVGITIPQSISTQTQVNFWRVLCSIFASSILVWVARRILLDMDLVPPGERQYVLAADAWMLILVVIPFVPVVMLSNVQKSIYILNTFNLSQIGDVAAFFLFLCLVLIAFWLLSTDNQSKRIVAEGIRAMLAASFGAACANRFGKCSRNNSTQTNSRLEKQ